MLDAWQWGVLAFLAVGWTISEAAITWHRHKTAEEAERIVTEMYRAAIEQILREER